MSTQTFEEIHAAIEGGTLIPYIGPGVLSLAGADCPLPGGPDPLVAKLTAKATVPHKIRKDLGAAAQFIENFKHRKTIHSVMTEAFKPHVEPTELHRWIASWPKLPLVVHIWYDDLMQQALTGRENCGFVQGVSQAEHLATWVLYFNNDRSKIEKDAELATADAWSTVLYEPWGSVAPEGNFLVSDSDFVEVQTEIDIQTPIPEKVQQIRTGRNFLYLGCRFMNQVERTFAKQISKRSSDKHWAVLPETPTKNEKRFLEQYNIARIDMPLGEFLAKFVQHEEPALV